LLHLSQNQRERIEAFRKESTTLNGMVGEGKKERKKKEGHRSRKEGREEKKMAEKRHSVVDELEEVRRGWAEGWS